MAKKQLSREMCWKCALPSLFEEILLNPGTQILKIPLNLTLSILLEVANRAIQLNDPILNELMCDLDLYETPTKSSKEFKSFIKKVRTQAQKQKDKELKQPRNKKNKITPKQAKQLIDRVFAALAKHILNGGSIESFDADLWVKKNVKL